MVTTGASTMPPAARICAVRMLAERDSVLVLLWPGDGGRACGIESVRHLHTW
jgi:hypothetical protein